MSKKAAGLIGILVLWLISEFAPERYSGLAGLAGIFLAVYVLILVRQDLKSSKENDKNSRKKS